MCHKIRCDGESWKLFDFEGELNKALVIWCDGLSKKEIEIMCLLLGNAYESAAIHVLLCVEIGTHPSKRKQERRNASRQHMKKNVTAEASQEP